MAGRNGVKIHLDEPTAELDDGDLAVGELQPDRSELAIDRSLVAVLEHSHPGVSESNGMAERTIQEAVDQGRTLEPAPESRLKSRLPCSHPVFAWLVEHAAYVLDRFQLGTDGRTVHGRLNGKETTERIAEFGERVLRYVPKMRAKMDARWRYSKFVGRSSNSEQHCMGLND